VVCGLRLETRILGHWNLGIYWTQTSISFPSRHYQSVFVVCSAVDWLYPFYGLLSSGSRFGTIHSTKQTAQWVGVLEPTWSHLGSWFSFDRSWANRELPPEALENGWTTKPLQPSRGRQGRQSEITGIIRRGFQRLLSRRLTACLEGGTANIRPPATQRGGGHPASPDAQADTAPKIPINQPNSLYRTPSIVSCRLHRYLYTTFTSFWWRKYRINVLFVFLYWFLPASCWNIKTNSRGTLTSHQLYVEFLFVALLGFAYLQNGHENPSAKTQFRKAEKTGSARNYRSPSRTPRIFTQWTCKP